MKSPRPLHVTLTGDRSGDYVVVEERPDGSLVLAPGPPRPPGRGVSPRTSQAGGSRLPGRLSRAQRATTTVPETLDAWGVKLLEGELVREFLLADIDGSTGFAAVTSRRFMFVAQTDRGPGVVLERLLSSVRDVEVVRSRRREKLRVRWDRSETLIGASDRQALSRLHQRLVDR